jgi:hypothetical protein
MRGGGVHELGFLHGARGLYNCEMSVIVTGIGQPEVLLTGNF